MNEEQLEGLVKELNEKIEVLETKNNEMLNEIQKVESERRYIESELFRTQKELKRMKSELERMKSPPLIIGSIKDVLVDGRVIVKSSTGPDFIVTTSEYVPQEDLVVGSRVALNKQTLAVMNVLPPSLDPLVTGAEIIEKPELSYSEIGGLEEQIMEVREAVEDPLLRPELYKKVGIDPPKGVLLVGPPGTGKTLLAKAVAHQTNATFIRFVGSELVQKYIGEGARLVRELFELAKEKAPSIVFIDELDSIGAKRLDVSTSGDREVQRTLMQLLSELDGFNPIGEVKIIGATNRPDILDDALLRPGRFDRIIEVPVPNYEGRLEILKIHTKKMSMDQNISLQEIALKADGATGAELKAICTEAGMFAIREGRDCVIATDFDHAISKILETETAKIVESGVMFA
ncbi:proteasome-activating nucleotidase [Candidatus Methanomassiliicoccus intestinalis]|uniref:proteasome-activating nucleotidase n=1 Tax=Candidatus Methanomassiliicoccus intestinalis TaxID=1406512 RepID=UPI0037DDA931